MPTVAVGTSTAGAEALGVLGFTGIPGRLTPCRRSTSTWPPRAATGSRRPGSTRGTSATRPGWMPGSSTGWRAGRCWPSGARSWPAADGTAAPGSDAPPLVSIASVLPVLAKAGVSPHGGPVDASFEAAMHLFKNNGYAASIPSFTKALELFPGHFLASRNLAIAKQRSGSGRRVGHGRRRHGRGWLQPGAGSAAGATSGGTSWWWPIGIVLAVAAAGRRGGAVPPLVAAPDPGGRGGRGGGPPPAATGPPPGPTARSRGDPPTGAARVAPVAPPRPGGAGPRGRAEVAARGCGRCVAGCATLRAPTGPHRSDRAAGPTARSPTRRLTGTWRACAGPTRRRPGGRDPTPPPPRRRSAAPRPGRAGSRSVAAGRPRQPVRRRHPRRHPATAPYPTTRCSRRGRPRSRPRGSAPPAAGASRHGTSSVGGAVNPSAETRTRRCP